MIAGLRRLMQVRGVAGHLPASQRRAIGAPWKIVRRHEFCLSLMQLSNLKIAAVRFASAGRRSLVANSLDNIRVMLSPSVTLLRRQRGAMLLVLTE